jgi:hypothetical protein
MSDPNRRNVPTVVPQFDPGLDATTQIVNAATVRNPFAALARSIGDNATIAALHSQGRVAAAFAWRLRQQKNVVKEADELQTAMETYYRNRLNLPTPEQEDQRDEEKHKRVIAEKRREKELWDAERQIIEAQSAATEAKHQFEAKEYFKETKFAAGKARFAQKIAEREVGEAVARASMKSESAEAPPPPPNPTSMADMLAELIDAMERKIDEAEAGGASTAQMREDLAALKAALKGFGRNA